MTGALTLDGLCKSYGSLHALTDLSFEVAPGELFGFVGSNGAGKTTAMRIVLGVLSPDSGNVTLGGKPLDLDLRRGIGYMPEERGLYPRMKVSDQLIYLARLHGLSPSDAQAAMLRWTDRLGVAARRDDEVQKLSLGNQQRVQLAAALSHNPTVLVLDEPFSGLDPVAVDVMSEVLLDRARSGVPVVFSSHQLDLVERLCDRVGIISSGELVASGTIDELRHGEPNRWKVTVRGGQITLPAGATEVSRTADTLVVDLPDGASEQPLLRAGLAAGEVVEFSRIRASLAELYRDVVAKDSPPPAVTPPGQRKRKSLFARSAS